MAAQQETLYLRKDKPGLKKTETICITGISLCPNERNLKSIRKMISLQMFIPGREVIIYFNDSEEIRRISPYDLEEARELPQKQRAKFLDGVMDELRFAERVAIGDTRLD